MDILYNRSFDVGIRGTYKAAEVDAYINRVQDEVKRLEINYKTAQMEIDDKNKLNNMLKRDLQLAQEEIIFEKSKSLEVDKRSIFIVEKERELSNRAKEVEMQCSERIEEIGAKGQAHLRLANEKANEIIREAQVKAEAIVFEAQKVAKMEIDKANATIEELKKEFDNSNTDLIDKQQWLADRIKDILTEVENLNYNSNLAGNIQYPQVDYSPKEIILEEVSVESIIAAKKEAEEVVTIAPERPISNKNSKTNSSKSMNIIIDD